MKTCHSDIIIEHGITPGVVKRGRDSVYPFRELEEVGDAMFIPMKDITEDKNPVKERSLRSLCVYWSQPNRWKDGKPRRFAVRYIRHKTGRYGYQITRTA